jgi:peptidyl-prolyl cis-trans isomerase C
MKTPKKTGVLKTKTYQEEYDAVIEKVKVQLAAKVWEQEQFEKVTIPEKEVKAYYEQNKEEFVEPEQVHARHILVKSEAEANKIIDQLKGLKGDALRDKFIALAKSESTGPSGPKGGDLGFFPRGQMVPEFNDAVFAMNVEAVSTAPVKSQFGYHIIFLEEKKPGKMASFDEVKGFIEQRLKLEKFKEIVDAKITELKASAKIDYAK